ncbi:MAG: ASKHA domain-containing protein [Spirochaetota bacterium]
MNTKKVTLTILPHNAVTSVDAGTTIADALFEAGIAINTPCGGKGICKKCAVRATGELSQHDSFEKSLGDSNYRLACRARIEGNAVVFADSIREHIHYPVLDKNHTYAVAIDIGTTTLQISFIDLTANTLLSEIMLLNPQRRFGHDVITRISHAANPAVATKLTQILVDAITSVITTTCHLSQAKTNIIQVISVCGNTVMSYSFLGINITPLGSFPYTTSITSFDEYQSYSPIKNIFPNATVTVVPVVSAFLGGDFLGGLGVLPHTKGNSFFFDIGTNGEMAIIKSDGNIIATSCAMGPAFEGMNISGGMTATEGAITHFWLDDNSLQYSSIGKPLGISGTALVDIIAICLEKGIITKSGTIANIPNSLQNEITITSINGVKALTIHDTVTITQLDIRNVQLAKGASLAASKILLKEAGLNEDDIDNVYIAGAFGTNVNINNFITLQCIPHFKNAHYHALGNTSLQAAITLLRDKHFMQRLNIIKKAITAIDLSMHREFNDTYIQSLEFNF